VLPVEWSTLLPGNLILLTNGDEVPADVVVLACGGIQGRTCYVETAAIDGMCSNKQICAVIMTFCVTIRRNKSKTSSSMCPRHNNCEQAR
jgi:hypothetical protein